MKTQTAVQNIIEKLKELRDLHPISGNLQERISRGKYVFAIQVAEKELETEKQQIINSWENGYQHGSGVNIDKDKYHGIQYYTSTFETNKETFK